MRRRATRHLGLTAFVVRRTADPARAGFTVLEVMLAMGIFVVGFAAVASLLPAAITLQRQAVADVTADQVARQAEATLRARPILLKELVNITGGGANYPYPTTSSAVPDALGLWALPVVQRGAGNFEHLLRKWSVIDRSYPSNLAEPSERTYFWVPMIQRVRVSTPAQPEDFNVVVLVLKQQEGTYDEIQLGVVNQVKFFHKRDPNASAPPAIPPSAPSFFANPGPEGAAIPFRDPNGLVAPYPSFTTAPEAPWIPKICAIQVEAQQGTDGTKLTFQENGQPYNLVEIDDAGLEFSGSLPARPVMEGYSTYENLKIRPTDTIIDQWGKVHTVLMAHEKEIVLSGPIGCPQAWFNNATGLLNADQPVWIWYAVPPARPRTPGAAYNSYKLSPGRSALVKVVAVQGAVIR